MDLKHAFRSSAFALAWDRYLEEDRDGLRMSLMDEILLREIGHIDGRRVLDAGSGNGWLIERLAARRPLTLTACDLSSGLMKLVYARHRKRGVEAIVCDLENGIAFRDQNFDCIVCYNVLMDLNDLQGAANEIRRVTAPGGRIHIVIVHPLFQLFGGVTQEVVGRGMQKIGLYCEERSIRVNIVKNYSEFNVIRRPISAYVNALCEARLSIDKMLEIPIPREYANSIGKPKWAGVPVFAYFGSTA